MIQSDCHMHTEFSSDSEAPVRSMIEGAIKKGLREICLTDHYDKDYPRVPDIEGIPFVFDPEEYCRTLAGLKEEYSGRITVRTGIEIGLQPHLGGFYRELTEKHPFDFVIGSVHLVHGLDPYYGALFEGRTDEEAYSETFRETLAGLEAIDGFDVLGHIDYVVRYGKEKAAHYSYHRFADEIDEILKKVIEMGKGIELNTGGFKYGLGFSNPHPDIIKRYRELGGEIITVGADAHKPEHIAYDFDKAEEILRECGFRYYTVFEGRKPIFRRLDGRKAVK